MKRKPQKTQRFYMYCIWAHAMYDSLYFHRSEEVGLQYTVFIGDGDSKSFLVAARGSDYNVVKEECVGHVKKRMGTRL